MYQKPIYCALAKKIAFRFIDFITIYDSCYVITTLLRDTNNGGVVRRTTYERECLKTVPNLLKVTSLEIWFRQKQKAISWIY